MLEVKKIDNANAEVSGKILADEISNKLEKIAKEASKSVSIQGFRKGKVPVKVVKQMYGDKLAQDAENEAFRDLYNQALKELEIDVNNLVGEPAILKFDKNDDGDIEVKMKFFIKPTINLGDYKSLIPQINIPQVSDGDVEEEIKQMAKQYGSLEKLKRKRALKDGDFAVIDFEGFLDGKPFEGGKASNHTLQIGSGNFIEGFEEQLIGMKYDEEREIKVTFPTNYHSKELAGKETTFKVKLHEIKQQVLPELDDELAKKILNKEDATIDELKNQVKENLTIRKKQDYYMQELKDKYLEILVEKIDFDLPENIVEQETNQLLNNKASKMSEEELNKLKDDKEAIQKMVQELEPEAKQSVKVTFLIDSLAKAENVEVSDDEVTQTLYYEAIMSGQEPKAFIEKYEKSGYLPVIKMSMLENKVLTKIFDEAAK